MLDDFVEDGTHTDLHRLPGQRAAGRNTVNRIGSMSILPQETTQAPESKPDGAARVPAGTLWSILAVAAFMWMAVPTAYLVSFRGGKVLDPAAPAGAPSADLTAKQTMIMVVSGGCAGLVTLILGTLFLPRGFEQLGISRKQLGRGTMYGALASVVLLPLMFGVMFLTDWFWRWIGFHHPTEHDLLLLLGESQSVLIRVAIVVSAVLLAPAFEEFLFRGYLQTAIRQTLWRWRSADADRPGAPVRWVAILLASVAFTAVHQHLWLMPPIFVLSLCLGGVYERTGNLWTAILMHSAFNAASTIAYLLTR
jgi:membrane protease YdiL (CAAX protease family)